jgi:hypothetical protein
MHPMGNKITEATLESANMQWNHRCLEAVDNSGTVLCTMTWLGVSPLVPVVACREVPR